MYVPLPTRCFRCQRFGHGHLSCHGKLTCPRCSGNHEFSHCTLTSDEGDKDSINNKLLCVNCGSKHSAAFKGCSVFIKNKEIAEFKTKNKLSYSQAVKQLKDQSGEIQVVQAKDNRVNLDPIQNLPPVLPVEALNLNTLMPSSQPLPELHRSSLQNRFIPLVLHPKFPPVLRSN